MLKINKTIGSCPTVVTQLVLRTHYYGVIPVSQENQQTFSQEGFPIMNE